MMIIGAASHPEFQQIASLDSDTGELQEKRLVHREEAEKSDRNLAVAHQKVRVGMEASGHARWFERLLAEFAVRAVDRRRCRDSDEARAQAEDRSPRFATDSALAAGGSVSADLGSELDKS
jgi:hypothetical protein